MTTVNDTFELEALMTAEQAVPEGPERLWFEREHLGTIRQFARARLASPWAVLGTVLMRVLSTVPPNVCLPPIVGGRASLNAFLALVGPSGQGKGAAMRAAADAVQIPNAPEVLPLGSGEGMVKAYAVREIDDVNGEKQPVTRMIRTSVLFETSEVDQLRAQGQRSGSTLMPQLRSAYSGEQLGATYAATEKAVILNPHEYRLTLAVGVQPRRSDALFSDSDGGTPQRFVWLPTADPEAQPDVEEPAPYRLPGMLWSTTLTELKIPAEARDQIKEQRVSVLKGRGDPLDGHAALTRLKVAAAFAILDGRQQVSRDDWRLAGIVMDKSAKTRLECSTALREGRDERAAEQGRADAVRQYARERTSAEQRFDRITARVIQIVNDNPDGITDGSLNRKVSPGYRDNLSEAIGRAMDQGQLERSGNELFPVRTTP